MVVRVVLASRGGWVTHLQGKFLRGGFGVHGGVCVCRGVGYDVACALAGKQAWVPVVASRC